MNEIGKKYVLWIGAMLAIAIFALMTLGKMDTQSGILAVGVISSKGSTDSHSRQGQVYLLPSESKKKPIHLSQDLFAARSPSLHFNGEKLVFTGKADENGPWQVYAYNFGEGEYHQVFEHDADCFDPVYLPTGEILFTSLVEIAPGTQDLALHVWRNSQVINRITYTPYSFSQPLILQDGRILALFSDNPDAQAGALMVMRPDGTKNNLFYKSPEGNSILGDLVQLVDGDILFLEWNHRNQATEIVSLDYKRPLASRKVLYSIEKSKEVSLGLTDQDMLLLSKPGDEDGKLNFYTLDPANAHLEPLSNVYPLELIEKPMQVAARERQKRLPSAVNPEVETALLMCQDHRISDDDDRKGKDFAGSSIEIQGASGSMAVFKAETDGSFYLKLKADTPFRLQKLDQEGHPVGKPSAWISLRPNERRACVGCHVSSERVPENVQPLAVRKEPVDLSFNEEKIMANSLD